MVTFNSGFHHKVTDGGWERCDAILVVCDQLSKMTHFVATTKGTLAEGLARLFRDNI